MSALRRLVSGTLAALLMTALPSATLLSQDSVALASQHTATAPPAERAADNRPFSLTVDLSDRQIHVVRGDEVVRSYAVAIGKPAHPTPKGDFSIRRITWNPRWVPPRASWARGKRARGPGDPRNPMGRVKMFFQQPDYYVHGTNDVDSLGEAESHGCIRMRNADVIELARMVMEHGGAPREPGWFQRVVNRVSSTQDVRLSAPVTFRVRE